MSELLREQIQNKYKGTRTGCLKRTIDLINMTIHYKTTATKT